MREAVGDSERYDAPETQRPGWRDFSGTRAIAMSHLILGERRITSVNKVLKKKKPVFLAAIFFFFSF